MLDTYSALRGWPSAGISRREKLAALGLASVVRAVECRAHQRSRRSGEYFSPELLVRAVPEAFVSGAIDTDGFLAQKHSLSYIPSSRLNSSKSSLASAAESVGQDTPQASDRDGQ